jgi:hypothetical protein
LERGRKDLVAASEPGGFASDAVGGRGENHLVPYMKKPIDQFRFEEYGDDVRGRPRLKENRGLASVDRTTRCVTCVQGWCWRGWANNSRREGATIGPLRGHGAGGLPGPGSFQNALGAREEFSRVAANGVASSVQDVNRYTAVVSDSPRRRSVGHASHSQFRDCAEARGNSAASLRPPPGPAPSEARGTPAASVNWSFDSTPRQATIRFIRRAEPVASAVERRRIRFVRARPTAFRTPPFLWYSPTA